MTGSFSDRQKEKDHFHKLDYQVMKHAFAIHNRMGNCHDEEVYQNELLYLLQKEGILANKEVPLAIQFRTFVKSYFLDLLLEDKYVYELKVIPHLTNQCRSQAINYQLISENPYGKLINFGGASVEHEFSSSTLTKAERKDFVVDRAYWDEAFDPNLQLYTLAHDLISDWGTRLNPTLYTEALHSLLPEAQEEKIEILSDNRPVGTKLVHLAQQGIAFKLTTSKKPNPLEIQFQKFINHTNLKAMLWINLNKDHVTFSTLKKK